MWRENFSVQELEFIAENTNIEVIPNFKKDKICLISGQFGEFKPNKPISIPLWLAVQYKKNKKCRVIPPIWMDMKLLKEKFELEKKYENVLQELPYYFYEICQILFNKAEDDITDIKLIKSAVEDLTGIRTAKINKFLETLLNDDNTIYISLNNICARELEVSKPFLCESFKYKLEVKNAGLIVANGTQIEGSLSTNNTQI